MSNEKVMRMALKALERVSQVDYDCDILSINLAESVMEFIDALRAAIAAQAGQSEPVAWRRPDNGQTPIFEYEDGITSFANDPSAEPLYTHPAPVRQPLSNDEIMDISSKYMIGRAQGVCDFARAIEAAHGIKS